MTTLVICWMLVGNTCIFGTHEVLPDHFSCVMVKRLWIERWITGGTDEPDLIECRSVK